MTTIPENEVTANDLVIWDKMQDELKKLKAAEMLLRKRIFAHYFPAPKEGTNNVPLAAGWVLKGKYSINREIDVGTLQAMRERFTEANINTDELVRYKPDLIVVAYKQLTEEQRKLFDSALIARPATPAIEIVLPAAAKKKAEEAAIRAGMQK